MKKISLLTLGLYLSILAAFSQSVPGNDSTYKRRKLKFEEANIVSSYYSQDGNNAAVTGGIGSQKLTDISNSFDLKLSKYDWKNRKNTFTIDIGIDHYTSASSDKIDPSTVSSASYSDTRIYPSLSWTRENTAKGTTIGGGIYTSAEYDYLSTGANINFSRKTRNRNGELYAKLQTYIDQVSLIYPIELRSSITNRPANGRKTYSGTLSWSQIINRNLQVMLEGELVYQQGFLSLPFNRVYFKDQSVNIEHLPDSRLKIPLGIRASYFAGDALILKGWYRYYKDDWGIASHTAQLETTVKLTPFVSVTPFYRYYNQTGTRYFAPYQVHSSADQFYTSNYDLSTFNSAFFGGGIRLAPPKGVLGTQHVQSLELRYGHYNKSIDMNANIVSLHLKFR